LYHSVKQILTNNMQPKKLSLRKQAPEMKNKVRNWSISDWSDDLRYSFGYCVTCSVCVTPLLFPTGRVWREWWFAVVGTHAMLLTSR